MKTFSSLRRINPQAPTPANISARLRQCGYEPYFATYVSGNCYLRFSGQFDDASEITGYIDVANWMGQALPKLSGMDWTSVDKQVLPSLMSTYPLKLELVHQHAPIQHCQIDEIVSNLAELMGLPVLEIASGTVMVKSFRQGNLGNAEDVSEIEALTVPLAFCIGSSILPCQALSQVEAGDVLLIEHVAGHVMTNKKLIFEFELNKGSIMILEHNENKTAQPGLESLSESDMQRGLARLPVELTVVLMEKTVTLAELKLIAPGEIMPLPQNSVLDVEIRANQQKFARGELIQLPDGQLGVEIRKIWS